MRINLGQHFLKNKSAIKKIVEVLEIQNNDTIIEVGPGHGELTKQIQNTEIKNRNNEGQKIKIIAIEKDKKFIGELGRKFSANKNVEIIFGDALKILPKLISNLGAVTEQNGRQKYENSKLKIVGNIPYYITGKLLRILSETKNKPSLCVFTFQKEVAERICAQPPKMNRLAAITKFWAKPEVIMRLPASAFSPQPEVDSAVIKLEIASSAGMMASRSQTESKRENLKSEIGPKKYYAMVKTLFAQPRKTILNNLAANSRQHDNKEKISRKLLAIGINPQSRPQNLYVEDIEKISKFVD